MSPSPLSRLQHMRQTLKSKGEKAAARVTKLFFKMDFTQGAFVPLLDTTHLAPIHDTLNDGTASDFYYKGYGIYRLDDADDQATAELLTVKKDYEAAKTEFNLHALSEFGRRENALSGTIDWPSSPSRAEVTVSYDGTSLHALCEIAEVRCVDWFKSKSIVNWRREDEWRNQLPQHWGVFEQRDCQDEVKTVSRGGYSNVGDADHTVKMIADQFGPKDRVLAINHGKMEYMGEKGRVEQRYFIASGRLVNKQYEPDNLELRQLLFARDIDEHSQDSPPHHVVAPMPPPEEPVRPVPDAPQTSSPPSAIEPLYCTCRRPDDGSCMIACDNPACEVAWFHLSCVGLTTPPGGKWYCGDACNSRKGKGVAIKKVARRAGSVAGEGKGRAGVRRKRGVAELEEDEDSGEETTVPVVKKRKIAQKKPRKAAGGGSAVSRAR